MPIKRVSKATRIKLEKIAKSEFFIETVKVRGRDHLDFHECSVISIMNALTQVGK